MNKVFGGTVIRKPVREDGEDDIEVDPSCLIFHDLGSSQRVLLTHGDSIDTVAKGFEVTAHSGNIVAG